MKNSTAAQRKQFRVEVALGTQDLIWAGSTYNVLYHIILQRTSFEHFQTTLCGEPANADVAFMHIWDGKGLEHFVRCEDCLKILNQEEDCGG